MLYCISLHAQNPFSASWPLQNNGAATTSGAITAQPVSTSSNLTVSSFTGSHLVTSVWNQSSSDKYIDFQVIPNANTTATINTLSYVTHFQSPNTEVFSYIYYSYDNFATSNYLTFNYSIPVGSNGTYQTNFSIADLTLSSTQPISFRIVADSNASNASPFAFVMSDFQLTGTSTALCDTPVFTMQPYPANQVVCANGINSISIISEAINISHYQWLHNGMGIIGQNGPNLNIFTISPSDSGTYTVLAINSCDEIVSSNSVNVTVNPIPTYYFDSDADGFGNPNEFVQSCNPTQGYVTNNLDCNDNNVTIYPMAEEICGDGIDNNCNGVTDENCVVTNQTTLQNNQCGSTLTSINQSIYANLVTGAQMYRFRVTDVITNQTQTIDRVLRVFNFTQLGTYAYGRTYTVEVAAKVANVFQPYGSGCSITTPTPLTKLQNTQCGITLTSFNTILYANAVQYVTGYRFKFINTATNQVYLFDRALRDFRVTSLPRIYQSQYNVEIAVKNTDGTYLPYGESCIINTPIVPVPSLVNCGVINNYQLVATSVSEATLYHFELVHEYYYTTGMNDFYFQFTNSSPTLSVSSYYNPYHTYYVRVRAEINGVLGAFSDFCTVLGNGQGVPDARLNFEDTFFEVKAAPNPFSSNFSVSIDSRSSESVNVKVFDMLGQLIEEKTCSELVIELGNNYSSGVYQVIIAQGNENKILRMIKR